LSRKRRRLSPPSAVPERSETARKANLPEGEDALDTDLKLAMLSSLHPQLEQQVLLDILLVHEGSVEAASASLLSPDSFSPKKIPRHPGYQSSLASFATTSSESAKRPKVLSKKGKTLFLYSPEDIAVHTPCSIIHNFLSPKDANALMEELMLEAPYEKITFKLFDNVVTSPHTSCFYVETSEEIEKQKTEYVYNGARLTVCMFPFISPS
jgi:hypothetical protein